jgi:hypothetical protein
MQKKTTKLPLQITCKSCTIAEGQEKLGTILCKPDQPLSSTIVQIRVQSGIELSHAASGRVLYCGSAQDRS